MILTTNSRWQKTLQHEFYQFSSDHLVITFPGFGYTQDHPLFYYLTDVMLQNKIDLLCVTYGFQSTDEKVNSDMAYETTREELKELFKKIDFTSYKKVTLIGKSFGTLWLEKVKEDHQLTDTKLIYLTPVDQSLPNEFTDKMVFVFGSKDTLLSEEHKIHIMKSKAHTKVIQGGDHSLEVGHYEGNIQTVLSLMKELEHLIIHT